MKRLLILLVVATAAAVPFAAPTAGSVAAKTPVCHKTSSATRPYVKLSVSGRALKAHIAHAADIVPAPSGACPRTLLTPTSGGVELTSVLVGETEIPAGDPVATGTSSVRLRRGEARLCSSIRAENLSGPATAAHIHHGVAGAAGPVVIALDTPNASGTVSGCSKAPRTLVAGLLRAPGDFYVNVHTVAHPAGAIRGQLSGGTANVGRSFSVALTGAAERPGPGDADGTGTAVLRIRRDANQVCYRLSVKDILLPATGAHIHRAPATAAGPVVIPFTAPGADGTSSGCLAADGALLDEILAGPAGFYFNVHSRDFPAGALRAQLA